MFHIQYLLQSHLIHCHELNVLRALDWPIDRENKETNFNSVM